jgi:hypothetical protein
MGIRGRNPDDDLGEQSAVADAETVGGRIF